MHTDYVNIDQYIERFPIVTQDKLTHLRQLILAAVPEASEKISYRMPAFYWKKVLVYFAAYDTFIGFYPTASGVARFERELTHYKTSKGAIHFPLDEPLPDDLIIKITQFRYNEVKRDWLKNKTDNPKQRD